MSDNPGPSGSTYDAQALIHLLEAIADNVKEATTKDQDNLDEKLDEAIATTSKIIQKVLPSGAQSEWLSDLSTITQTHQPHTKPSSAMSNDVNLLDDDSTCNCPAPLSSFPSGTDSKSVQCLHECGVYFCSATCRKRGMKTHRKACTALARKKIMSQIGLSVQPELF